jgi:hypothetical protein
MTEQQLADATLGNWLAVGIVLALIVAYVVWAINEAREDFDRRIGGQMLDLELREVGLADVMRERLSVR